MVDDGERDWNETERISNENEYSPSLNAILEVLAHHHRREILRALVGAPDHTASVDELAGRICDREIERTGERPGRDQIEMALHHVHLPKLADLGLVEYDARSQELRYRRNDLLENLLEYLDDEVSSV